MSVRNMHQHAANELFNSFLCTCAPRFAVSTTLRNGSEPPSSSLQCLCDVVLVAAPFRSNNNRQNVAARNSRCQAHGYCDATDPPSLLSCHNKCPATGEEQPHQQCSVNRRLVPTNNSGEGGGGD